MKSSRRGGAVAIVLAAGLLACSASDEPESGASSDPQTSVVETSQPTVSAGFVGTITPAIEAVEAELGGPQEFFEVTANARFTNVFVAVDDGAAAVGYLYVDGELAPAGPKQEGASGSTFTRADVDFDPVLVLSGVEADLPTSTIEALSVYGTGISAVYVVGVTSDVGGFLDIEVGPAGQIFSVDPL